MARFILMWPLNAISLMAVVHFIPGIHLDSIAAALVAALILSFINTLVRPIFLVLTLPVIMLTRGLLIFIINGVMFWLVGSILSGFTVDGLWQSVLGAALYSMFSWALLSATTMILPPAKPLPK